VPIERADSPRRSRRRARLHVGERKGPLVSEFGDPLVGRTIAVRALRLDADQHRFVTALRALQRARFSANCRRFR